MIDFLARLHGAGLVVRFNGASQCGHNVVTHAGLHHEFAQFGSGSFVPGVKTHLSHYMLVEPFSLLNEAEVLAETLGTTKEEVMDRLTIDPVCPVITPYHWLLNRLREESRGGDRHGSCGMGVAELRGMQAQPIRTLGICHLGTRFRTVSILKEIRDYVMEQAAKISKQSIYYRALEAQNVDWLAECYHRFAKTVSLMEEEGLSKALRNSVTIFEGGQGVLLDQTYGFAPYNTWSDTTARNALMMIDEGEIESTVIGVLRTYFTRHGAGPFVSECEMKVAEDHNTTDIWQGPFRVGLFDRMAVNYSLAHTRVDEIALTHIDELGPRLRYVEAYRDANGDLCRELPDQCAAVDLAGMTPVVAEMDSDEGDVFEQLIGRGVEYLSWGRTAHEKRRKHGQAKALARPG